MAGGPGRDSGRARAGGRLRRGEAPAPIGVSKEMAWPIGEARAWPPPLPEMGERGTYEPLIRWKEDDLMKTRLFLASAIAAAIAVPAVTGAQPAPAPKFEAEKCYGITQGRQERLPDRQLLVRGDVEAGRPAGRVGVRPQGDVRPPRQRQHAAQGVRTQIGAMRMGGVTAAGASGPGLPARAGIGLRSPHVAEVLATRPALPWLEVHPENYLGGGPAVRALLAVRQEYPLVVPRGRALGRKRRRGGPAASGSAQESRGSIRACPRVGAPRVEPDRGRVSEPPASAALHGGVARGGLPERRRGPDDASAGAS